MDTGIVTTTRITHASPAGTYAKTANREWECDTDKLPFPNTSACTDIAQQLIRTKIGQNFKVIYGGGRNKFIPSNAFDEDGQRGQRSDGLNLIDEWIATKNSSRARYIHNSDGLRSLNSSDVDYVLGLFAADHLEYKLNAGSQQPTLKEMTVSAIELLKKNPSGFVLFVEGGRIDHAHHANLARHAMEETVEFSEAIRAATEITDEQETLIVVTADHAHTMSISGYSDRGTDILGLNTDLSDVDDMPYTTLSYANGLTGGKPRYRLTEAETSELITFSPFEFIKISFCFRIERFSLSIAGADVARNSRR